MSKSPIIQDTLSFQLEAETTITNQTVKITAVVAAVIDGQKITNENISSLVRDMLNNLVTGEWSFSNPSREKDETGYERASFTATVRVDQTQNFNLDQRAEDASQVGLRITQVYTDTSTPKRAIAEAETALRGVLLERAANQAKELSTRAGRTYRVASLSYSSMNNSASNIRASAQYSLESATSFAAAPPGGGAIGHSQKLSMTANVTLATAEGTPTDKNVAAA